jgi:hypothetical protein
VDRDDVGAGPVDAMSYAVQAAKAGPERAIPVLERFYSRHQNDPAKDGLEPLRDDIASLLVQLGDNNPIYWNLLVSEATAALNSEIPPPNLQKNAATYADTYSPEQLTWAKQHGMTTDEMFLAGMYTLPAKFAPLAKSGDPRALPLLRQALQSDNHMIKLLGAAGLAVLRDTASVPLIIDACRRDGELGSEFADTLMFFHDPKADEVFKEYFPDVNIQEARRFRGDNPFCCTIHRQQ